MIPQKCGTNGEETEKGRKGAILEKGINISINFPSPIKPYAKNPRQLNKAKATIIK